MPSSNYTNKMRRYLWTFRAIDFLVLFAPIIVYFFVAMFDGGVVTTRKVALVTSVLVALIMALVNTLFMKRMRSTIWIVFLGLYISQINLTPLILITAVGSILDEFVLSPLIENYKSKLNSSKVIDQRMKEDGTIE